MGHLTISGRALGLEEEVAVFTAVQWFMKLTESEAGQQMLGVDEALGYCAVLSDVASNWAPDFANEMETMPSPSSRQTLPEMLEAALLLTTGAAESWGSPAALQRFEGARGVLFAAAESAGRAVAELESEADRLRAFTLAREIFHAVIAADVTSPTTAKNKAAYLAHLLNTLVRPLLSSTPPEVVDTSIPAVEPAGTLRLRVVAPLPERKAVTVAGLTLDPDALITDFGGATRPARPDEAWLEVRWASETTYTEVEMRAAAREGLTTLFVSRADRPAGEVTAIIGVPQTVLWSPTVEPSRRACAALLVRFLDTPSGLEAREKVDAGAYTAVWAGRRGASGQPIVERVSFQGVDHVAGR